MINWITQYWQFIIVGIAIGIIVYKEFKSMAELPTKEQKQKVKEWLVWACIEAEKSLQSGTGQLKLREVWNKFCNVSAFSAIATILSFEQFSEWVDSALYKVKIMLTSNESLATYVYGDNATEEVEKLKSQLK